MKNAAKSSGFFVLIVLIGAIFGGLLGDIIGQTSTLYFLKHVYTIGTTSPLNIDLKVINFTFGFKFNMNIMSIIGAIVAIILYRKY